MQLVGKLTRPRLSTLPAGCSCTCADNGVLVRATAMTAAHAAGLTHTLPAALLPKSDLMVNLRVFRTDSTNEKIPVRASASVHAFIEDDSAHCGEQQS